jgi:urease subunit alpha
MTPLSRVEYIARYGPTLGDRIQLGDTNLTVKVERDDARYGEEVLGGWGKTLRSGMSLDFDGPADSELDAVVTNVVVIDPVLGIRKTNIGIRDGLIAAIGQAGNPDTSDGVEMHLGPGTVAIPGENLIATAGGVDTHVHLRTPRLMPAALASGITTLVTGGTMQNPAFNLHRAFESFENLPLNVGMLGRAGGPQSMRRQVEDGACGIKVHEDYAGYPRTIDDALEVSAEYDVTVAMHTDGMNEAGSLADTISAIRGRAIHAYHVEGSGGGHPDVIRIASEANVIGSSTTPTIPYGRNATAELEVMMWAVHGMNRAVPSNREMVAERIRDSTIRAESYLQDLGAISITNSDSQGMGRIGEVIRRTWQLAHQMKQLQRESPTDDNQRVRQYLAKYTINPARAHGLARWVGSLEVGKLADIVLWEPAFFGIKPETIVKGGYAAWGVTGDGNATIVKCEPTFYGPLVGGEGTAPGSLAVTFVSEASRASFGNRVATRRRLLAVSGCSRVAKADMLFNDASPTVTVDPSTGDVFVDGGPVPTMHEGELPLSRRYLLL